MFCITFVEEMAHLSPKTHHFLDSLTIQMKILLQVPQGGSFNDNVLLKCYVYDRDEKLLHVPIVFPILLTRASPCEALSVILLNILCSQFYIVVFLKTLSHSVDLGVFKW